MTIERATADVSSLVVGIVGGTGPQGRGLAVRFAAAGLLDPRQHAAGRAVLTLHGRLLADAVVRDLVD